MAPFISICIPAYKNAAFLQRLLESIVLQDFTDYEVIITDDSPNQEVALVVNDFQPQIAHLHYIKNDPVEGMPQNWNVALKKSKGTWIKIMHDDDWFSGSDSLGQFAIAARQENIKFIFSDFNKVKIDKGSQQSVSFPKGYAAKLAKMPLLLMANNYIGPPSVCLVHKDVSALYNGKMHWLVDIDYYIQILLKEKNCFHIAGQLVNIGINDDQITGAVKNDPRIEIPEARMLLEAYGVKWLQNVWIYDAWWRLFRNLNIRGKYSLEEYGGEHWPKVIYHIIKDQSMISRKILKNGLISKLLMYISFLSAKSRKILK